MGEIVRDRIKALIIEMFELDIEPVDIENNELVLEGDFGLDSMSTLELIEYVEEEFEIEVEDEDITSELFESVNSLSKYIEKKIKEKND